MFIFTNGGAYFDCGQAVDTIVFLESVEESLRTYIYY